MLVRVAYKFLARHTNLNWLILSAALGAVSNWLSKLWVSILSLTASGVSRQRSRRKGTLYSRWSFHKREKASKKKLNCTSKCSKSCFSGGNAGRVKISS